MSETPDTITVRLYEEVLFRLHEGRKPFVYPSTVIRVSYEIGVNVLHTGTVWALGHVQGAEAIELDDGTVVLAADIDPDSIVVDLSASLDSVEGT